MAHGDAPRYRAPEIKDDYGITRRQQLIRDPTGQWVDFQYFERLKNKCHALTKENAELRRELYNQKQINEARELFEVAIMKMGGTLPADPIDVK